tara:strand:+ start:864 stop:986 length:123 start_codon:yes stop_codon:yes gene_type:complete
MANIEEGKKKEKTAKAKAELQNYTTVKNYPYEPSQYTHRT